MPADFLFYVRIHLYEQKKTKNEDADSEGSSLEDSKAEDTRTPRGEGGGDLDMTPPAGGLLLE